jgi:hypothetical protein
MDIGYEMDGKNLNKVDEVKDLSVIMQSILKWNRQCTKAVKTANKSFRYDQGIL